MRRLRQARLAGLDHERELQPVAAVRLLLVIADQRLGDAELAVGLEVRVLRVVDLRSDGLEAGLVDQKVQVRGAHVVALLRGEQRARRSVGRHRVAGGLDAGEAERAVLARGELAAQVHLGLRRVLVLVEADGGGMPDVDLCLLNRLTSPVTNPSFERKTRTRRRRAQQRRAVFALRRSRAEERAEIVGLRRLARC